MTAAHIPLVQPKAQITEALIKRLVHDFYGRVLQDERGRGTMNDDGDVTSRMDLVRA